ncbi:MAG: N-acylneuraminate cytidylyltransferase [Bacteroidota bacterium]|jgi:3-deoxy-manno-octulosonate cytidylyltransferase (CMP-KDO synthetase)
MNSQQSVLAIIPARFASTRFPGKPLVEISGKTMIQRTYEQVCKVGNWADVIIATDDERIQAHVLQFGARVLMTSSQHLTGTDRCAEVLQKCGLTVDYVVNIQGDEPFIDPKQIQALRSGFDNRPELVTLIKKIADLGTLFNPNNPKVIVDANKQAIYFSRQTLPYLRNVPQDQWLSHGVFYKHIGLYAYRADILPKLSLLKPSPLELAESLEQLRWIENGYQIQTVETNIETIGIDTPEDLVRIKELGLIS